MKKSEIVQRLEAIEKHIGIAKKYDEVVKGYWYWFEKNSIGHIQDALIFVNDVTLSNNGNYGFSHAGKWLDGKKVSYAVFNNLKIGRKATIQEVEEALIREAKRIGLIDGVRIKSPWIDKESKYGLGGNYEWDGQRLLLKGSEIYTIMRDGIWAEPIQEEPEQDKFSELKEAHSKGAVIQCKPKCTMNYSCWVDEHNPKWNPKFEYRIKPEEPNVGDIVKVWDAKEGKFFIGTLYKKGIYDVPYPFMVKLYNSRDDYNFYGNAEKITKEEAIKLLFG